MELEQIEKYVRKQMNAAEQSAFEQEMQGNDALTEEVAAFADANQIVQAAGDAAFLHSLREIEAELESPQQRTRPLWQRNWMMAAAAAVIILLAALWLLQPAENIPSALFAENFQAYPPPAQLRGDNSADALWEQARSAYVNEDYTTAAIRFEALLAKEDNRQAPYLVHFYAGMSQLAMDPPQLAEAIGHLQVVAETDSDYYQPAQWYLALAWLKNGDATKAKALLEKMAAESSYRKSAVEALLKEL